MRTYVHAYVLQRQILVLGSYDSTYPIPRYHNLYLTSFLCIQIRSDQKTGGTISVTITSLLLLSSNANLTRYTDIPSAMGIADDIVVYGSVMRGFSH